MKILVTVKEVAEVEDEFDISGLDIAEGSLEYDLNEWDDYAVEEAVQFSEAHDDVEVVTATIGPERADETIRMALAKGADRAIRVWDETLKSSQFIDINTKAEIIRAVADEEDPDFILTGVQAGDDANGATGVSLAQRLGFEWGAVVNQLEIDPEAGVASVRRELEGGIEELTDITLPAVLTIQTGINEPRYASLRGIRQAQRKPLENMTLDDIGLDAQVVASPVERTDMYEPESESDATIWEGDAGDTAAQLADFLRETGVVEG